MTATMQRSRYYEFPDDSVNERRAQCRADARMVVARHLVVWLPATDTRPARFAFDPAKTVDELGMGLRIALCEMRAVGDIQVCTDGTVRLPQTTTQQQLAQGGPR